MSSVAVVDHKVAIAVPSASLGPDHFDDARPWITSMIVVGKARTKMTERAALHLNVGHRHVLLWSDRGVDGVLETRNGFRLTGQVQHRITVVCQNLADHAGIASTDFVGVMDVVHHVKLSDHAQFAAVDHCLGAFDTRFVNVVVHRHAFDAGLVNRVLHLRQFLKIGRGWFFNQHVFASLSRLDGVMTMGFHVG